MAGADPEADGAVSIRGHEVSYAVVRSTRARRLRLRIGPSLVTQIIVPSGQRIPAIPPLLESNADWIVRQMERLTPEPAHAVLADGAELPYLGEIYRLSVLRQSSGHSVQLHRGELVVAVAGDGRDHLAAVLEGWYRGQARDVLVRRSDHWAREMGTTYERLTVKDQRTRWGSCSRLGNLSFSWRLVIAPMPVLDYVVIHELAHRFELNHSPSFWQCVERFCPDRRAHQAWLRTNTSRLAMLLRES
jgi:predicted metal-dependent hydrolase